MYHKLFIATFLYWFLYPPYSCKSFQNAKMMSKPTEEHCNQNFVKKFLYCGDSCLVQECVIRVAPPF
ncbi:hypothetical protein AQUCO_01800115v1 [Aquilegia coerulea]|uniref:Secreted protein n=1 Tax=Aquilegia coerulea TaxID=218851 RepID=A0A2G5DK30_AQUCA|nr:hypothetical protein AQUCO_01800115v1 [Aquilegia coerulea]